MDLKVLVKVGLLIFFMRSTATTVNARLEASFDSETDFEYSVKSTTTAWCDLRVIAALSYTADCNCLYIHLQKAKEKEKIIVLKRERERMELVKVGLMVFLMGFAVAATSVNGRFDPSSLISEVLPRPIGEGNYYYVKSTTTACCDTCLCTKSDPPQCQCVDVGTTCHSACKMCLCNRKFPPDCWCNDVNSFCYDKCTSVKHQVN
ncbi:hypothetical protein VNO78_15322 [Psophocarpus tetragonolobus]|uniref:Bowman-Birk serine protease inhibitors family domain-containing protein n=1 Tax=Psophocarpus tetragonolobus TaxID=3891 RepID=A0AAN9XJT4_PSOTE